MTWLEEAKAGIQRRLRAAQGHADVAALLRELVRLGGGQSEVMAGVEIPPPDLLDRFGLSVERRPGGWMARSIGLPGSIPSSLRSSLEDALRVDSRVRRVEVPSSPDAVFLRLSSHQQYRNPTQKAAVRALLTMPKGAGLLATMATGSGKSLLFLLGIRWWREQRASHGEVACAVVIVPTVSLALNHRDAACVLDGLEGCRAVTGDMVRDEREAVRSAFLRGEVPLLFLSPEVALGAFRETLVDAARPMNDPGRVLAARGRLCALFVDEAHIVASWGRSFRPDFQRIPGLLRSLREQHPDLRTVLLSATVDAPTLALLRSQYRPRDGIDGQHWLEVSEGMPRREFDIVAYEFSSGEERDDAVLAVVDVMPRPALVYTTEREHAAALEKRLRVQRGYSRLALFTGDTGGAERAQIVRQWREGRLDLVVATSAFGMGIDQNEVRAVVHACMPEDAPRYYQEIGRAGRDGHQALAVLMYCGADLVDAASLEKRGTLTFETAAQRWRALLQGMKDDGRDEDSRLRHSVVLGARGAHLDDGPVGRRNRTWNKALLVQLQRYGALEISTSGQNADTWSFTFTEQGSALADPATFEAPLHELFQRSRGLEVSDRVGRNQAFSGIWRDAREVGGPCVLAAVFALVDASEPIAGPCGRCPGCRANDARPQNDEVHGGTAVRWRGPSKHVPRSGPRLLLAPSGAAPAAWLAALRRHEGGLPVEQLIVPDTLADETARIVSRQGVAPGWILCWSEVLRATGPVVPLLVPTALVLPGGSGPLVEAAWRFRMSLEEERNGTISDPVAWVIASSDTVAMGRSIADIASTRKAVWLEECV